MGKNATIPCTNEKSTIWIKENQMEHRQFHVSVTWWRWRLLDRSDHYLRTKLAKILDASCLLLCNCIDVKSEKFHSIVGVNITCLTQPILAPGSQLMSSCRGKGSSKTWRPTLIWVVLGPPSLEWERGPGWWSKILKNSVASFVNSLLYPSSIWICFINSNVFKISGVISV